LFLTIQNYKSYLFAYFSNPAIIHLKTLPKRNQEDSVLFLFFPVVVEWILDLRGRGFSWTRIFTSPFWYYLGEWNK